MSDDTTRKQVFIQALAEFLVSGQVRKSIELGMEKPHAKEWAKLRGATPLFGYPTVEEAVVTLTDFLK